MPGDFQDLTPAPDPAPKKRYLLTPKHSDSVQQPIPWPAGQTFQQALGAALPAAIRNKTNLTDFRIILVVDATEA
jgi:hypothetical protein